MDNDQCFKNWKAFFYAQKLYEEKDLLTHIWLNKFTAII